MIMLTKAERIRKVIRLCEAIEKSVDTLLLEQAKEWLKRFIGEPWYGQAIQAYVGIAREAGGIFADHRQKVLEAIGREELFQELTDPNVNMGAAVTPVNTTTAAAIVPVSSGGKKGKKTKARSVKSYKTWEYLDAWYNHVVVDDVRDTLLELEQEFQNKLEEFYQQKVADKLMPEASKGILEQVGMEFDFNKYDEATRDYLKDKKIHWAKQVAEETEKDIKAQLVKGYEAGLSSYEIADNIKQSTGFSMSRAEKIARTEVMSSCNYAQYAASEANPDIVGHYWRSQNSSRTRATHRAANKQYRPMGEPFDIGGAKLMFPGDGSLGAPAKEIINCRCWLEMVFRGEEPFDKYSVAEKDKTKNAFTVNFRKIYTKAYTDKYIGTGKNRIVDNRIKNEAVEMLRHRSGTEYEDLVFLDTRTGKNIIKRVDSAMLRGVKLKQDEIEKIQNYEGKLVSIHNHPGGTRPSLQDLILMAKNEKIEKLIVAGHDGSLHIISDLNRSVDLKETYQEIYNEFVALHQNKQLADLLAMDEIYKMGLFNYQER